MMTFTAESPPSQARLSNYTPNETMSPLTEDDLLARDKSAIEYTKSLLNSGDTLVFIKYPGEVYDPTGFSLHNENRRVNSEKLLATGSAKFAKLLQDDWKQHLMRKRNGYLNPNTLPTGIKYVLDLTPPDEGEEAVDLISSLSCSVGVRSWYSAQTRCGVSATLVGGKVCLPFCNQMFQDFGKEIKSLKAILRAKFTRTGSCRKHFYFRRPKNKAHN